MRRNVAKMTQTQEVGERLGTLIASLSMTQSAFADRIGKSQGYISSVINGSRNLSHSVANQIVLNFPTVNITWLLSGAGWMFLDQKPNAKDPTSPPDAFDLLRSVIENHEERLLKLEARLNELELGK